MCRQHNATHRSILRGIGQRGVERIQHLLGQRIELARAVQPQGADAALLLDQDIGLIFGYGCGLRCDSRHENLGMTGQDRRIVLLCCMHAPVLQGCQAQDAKRATKFAA